MHVGDSDSFGGAVESGHCEHSSPTSMLGTQGAGRWGMGQGGASAEEGIPNTCIPQLGRVTSLLPEHMAAGKGRHWHSHSKMPVQECQ